MYCNLDRHGNSSILVVVAFLQLLSLFPVLELCGRERKFGAKGDFRLGKLKE
jgi:hypothetical protein